MPEVDAASAGALVVITRPIEQAAPLARAVTALGRAPVLFPLLEIGPAEDPAPLQAALAQLPECALAVFVSPNAVEAAFAQLAAWPAQVALAVVGAGSRQALARHGVTSPEYTIYSPSDAVPSDSEHLLATLELQQLAGRRVLIVRGDGGRELLADSLRAAGAEVLAVAAYRRSVPALAGARAVALQSLLTGQNDWIITSSEALRGLVAQLEHWQPQAQQQPGYWLQRLRQQHLIVPHERIAASASALGMQRVTLCGSGDARLLAALQSQQ